MKTHPAWKTFENNIRDHSKVYGIFVLKIPESVRLIKGFHPIRTKTAFDFTAGVDGLAVYFDAKCVSERNSFNYDKYLLDKKHKHQWLALQEAWDAGNISGLLVWFPKKGLIGWASVPILRKSIQHETFLGPETQGVIWQSDDNPINLRLLICQDIRKKLSAFANRVSEPS